MSTQIVGIALRLRVALRMPLTISSDDRSLEWDFCLIFAPLRATMSQKSSHPQAAKPVSRVLMSDRIVLAVPKASSVERQFHARKQTLLLCTVEV